MPTVIPLNPVQTCYWVPDSCSTPRQAVAVMLNDDHEPILMLLLGLMGAPRWVPCGDLAATEELAWLQWDEFCGGPLTPRN